jgi:hypothetical protein
MNIHLGRVLFQIVWWGWPLRFGYWRWPSFEDRQRGETVSPGRWMKLGFHSFSVGPAEFRLHLHHGVDAGPLK